MNPRADSGPEAEGGSLAAHTNPIVAGGRRLLRRPALEEDE